MMGNELVKSAIEGLGQAIIDSALAVKKHEALSATLVNVASNVLADQQLKDEVSALMVAGLSGLMTELKAMGSDISGDIELVVAEIPVIKKVIAALSA